MRILYGLNSQGQGHLSKAAVLIPLLQERGHEVRVISSGPLPPACYAFSHQRHFAGLEYEVRDGRTDFLATVRAWTRQIPSFVKALASLRRIVQEFEPQLIWSDFEPFTASPFLQPKCEVISVCRQVALLDKKIPLPPQGGFEAKLTKSVFHMFCSGADRRFGYHYEPASYRCLPPVVRDEVNPLRRVAGEAWVIYAGHHTTEKDPAELIAWSRKHRAEVIAYGFNSRIPPGRVGQVEFRAPERGRFLKDLAAARGLLTTAGWTSPLEAFRLGVPVCVTPIENQWEQQVNAFHLEQAGIAQWSRTWDYDALLELEPPPFRHPLRNWLSQTPQDVLNHVLGEQPAVVKQPLRRAA